jgi:hypothetical protein
VTMKLFAALLCWVVVARFELGVCAEHASFMLSGQGRKNELTTTRTLTYRTKDGVAFHATTLRGANKPKKGGGGGEKKVKTAKNCKEQKCEKKRKLSNHRLHMFDLFGSYLTYHGSPINFLFCSEIKGWKEDG